MNLKQDKITKELIKRLNYYPPNSSLRKINLFSLIGGLIGLVIGIFVNISFWSFVYSHKMPTPFFAYFLSHFNSLYYPKYASIFFNILAIPIFFMLIGVLLGKGLEVLVKKNIFVS